MEAYKIWASLNLKGDALKKMKDFLGVTKKTRLILAELNKQLTVLSPKVMNLAAGFSRLGQSASASAVGMKDFNSSLNYTAAKAARVNRQITMLATSMNRVGSNGVLAVNIGALPGLSGGGSRGGNRARSGGMHASVGRHGVHTPVLGFSGAAVGGVVAGYAGYRSLHAGFEAQKEYQRISLQARAGGLSVDQLTEAQGLSKNSIEGLSRTDMLRSYANSFMATRDWGEAKHIATTLGKSELASKGITGHEMSPKQQKDLVKFAEMYAGSNPQKILEGLEVGFKLNTASGGTLDASQMAAFMRRANTAAYKLTPQGFAQLEPILQELTGTVAGTGYQTGYQMMATGAGTLNQKKRVAHHVEMGFSKAQYDRNGRVLSTKFDPELLELYRSSPVDFVKKINETYRSKGVKEKDFPNMYALDFPNTTSRLLALIQKNMEKSDRQLELFQSQFGIEKGYQEFLKTPEGSSARFTAAKSNLATAFGEFSSPAVIGGMNALSALLENLALLFRGFNGEGGIHDAQKANIAAMYSRSPLLGSLLPNTGTKNSYDDYGKTEFGGYSASVIGAPKKEAESVMQGNVYLDKYKVGSVLIAAIHARLNAAGGVGGPTSIIGSLTEQPIGLTNYGSP